MMQAMAAAAYAQSGGAERGRTSQSADSTVVGDERGSDSGSASLGRTAGTPVDRAHGEAAANIDGVARQAASAADTSSASTLAASSAAAKQAVLVAKVGLAAVASRNAALQAARAAAAVQVAAQGPSIPSLEKPALAASAATAAQVVSLARQAAEETHVAAMLAAVQTVALARQAAGAAAVAATAASAARRVVVNSPRTSPPELGDVALPTAPLPLPQSIEAAIDALSAESMSLVELATWAAAQARSHAQSEAVTSPAARDAVSAVASSVLAVHAIAEALGDCTVVEAEGMQWAKAADLDSLASELSNQVGAAAGGKAGGSAFQRRVCIVGSSTERTAFLDVLDRHVPEDTADVHLQLPPGRAGLFHSAKLVSDALDRLEQVRGGDGVARGARPP